MSREYFVKKEEEISNSYMNAAGNDRYSNFIGIGTGFKIIWIGIVGLVVLAVVAKGVNIYKQTK
tara:strand:- start:1413 stop:1604 length:192 start_codon:yes stop_codon:yes gene_type:complete